MIPSILAMIAAFAVYAVAPLCWRLFTQRLSGIHGCNWAAVSAVVDVVSVVKQMQDTAYGTTLILGYLATLTYFYRNPELQTGDYSRMFDDEADAQAWVASYKGRTIMVHVDPRDPSHSVLRKEELSVSGILGG
jgi:hypothetical protein